MPDDDRVETTPSAFGGADTAASTRSWSAAALASGLVVLAALAVWAALTGTGPAEVDAGALNNAVEVRTPGLTDAAILITTVGSTVAMAVLAVVVGAVLWARGRPVDAAFLLLTMATASLVFRGIKIWLDRPRPPVATRLVPETNESLPSGHATMSLVVIGTLVVIFWAGRATRSRVLMVLVAAAWVAMVGATRIYLGVHWFSDVVAGWAVGAAWLTVSTMIWRRYRERRPVES